MAADKRAFDTAATQVTSAQPLQYKKHGILVEDVEVAENGGA